MALLCIEALLQLVSPIAASQPQSFGVAGAAFATTGFSIMIRAWWIFRQHKTAICPTAETTTLTMQRGVRRQDGRHCGSSYRRPLRAERTTTPRTDSG